MGRGERKRFNRSKPERPAKPIYSEERNEVLFSRFKLPVKDKQGAKKVVDGINYFLERNRKRVLTDYFGKSENIVNEVKRLDSDQKRRFFQLMIALDNEYLFSNKITPLLYDQDNSLLFQSVLRGSIKGNPFLKSKKKPEQKVENFQSDILDKPMIIDYNQRDRFSSETHPSIETFSFLEDLLKEFLKEKGSVFKKLKEDANLAYGLEIKPVEGGFECRLEEQSVVKKAHNLNKELNELEDKPKEIASRFDRLKRTAKEVISKCGVESIEEVVPLYEHTKKIDEFKFSEKDIEKCFFASPVSKESKNQPTHFCIFSSKDKRKPIDIDSYVLKNIKYVNGDSIEDLLNFLFKEDYIDFDSKKVKEELEKIETKVFGQLKLSEKPSNNLEKILKVRDVELPESWYALRDLYEHKKVRSKDVMPFISITRKSELLKEVVDSLKMSDLDKIKKVVINHLGKGYKANFGGGYSNYYISRKGSNIASINKKDSTINVYEKGFEPIARQIVNDLKKLGIKTRINTKTANHNAALEKIRDVVKHHLGVDYKAQFSGSYSNYYIHKKGSPNVASINRNTLTIYVNDKEFEPTAIGIIKSLKAQGIKAKLDRSRVEYKAKLEKIDDVLKKCLDESYKVDLTNIYSNYYTHIFIRKKGRGSAYEAAINKKDLTVKVEEKDFEPIAARINEEFKKLGLESKINRSKIEDKERIEKVKDTLQNCLGKDYKADLNPPFCSNFFYIKENRVLGSDVAWIKKDSLRIKVKDKAFEPTAIKIREELKKIGLKARVDSSMVRYGEKIEKLKNVLQECLDKKYKIDSSSSYTFVYIKENRILGSEVAWVNKNNLSIEVNDRKFEPTAERIKEELEKLGYNSKISMSRVEYREKVSRLKSVVQECLDKDYKICPNSYYYLFIRENRAFGPNVASINKDDFTIEVEHKGFEPTAKRIRDELKRSGYESKIKREC